MTKTRFIIICWFFICVPLVTWPNVVAMDNGDSGLSTSEAQELTQYIFNNEEVSE